MIARLRTLVSLGLLWLVTAYSASAQDTGQQDLCERHRRAMRPVSEVFASQPVRIEYSEGDPADGQRITFHWQDGEFRQEYHWLGFTEVFAYDGQDYWYGSDLSLPYTLERAGGADVTAQLAGAFAYLAPGQPLAPAAPADIPLDLAQRYAVLRYAPPGMSEALLLLDPFDSRLAGMLTGTEQQIAGSQWYKLTMYEDWADFGPCWYPAVIHTTTISAEGVSVHERSATTQSVTPVPPLDASLFQMESSLSVARPGLPEVPFEVPFSFTGDTVVVRCEDPTGKRIEMELDTGANVGLLRRDEAERLGLLPVGDELVSGHGGTAAVGYVRLEGFRLNGARYGDSIELPPFPAAVLASEGALDESLARNRVSGLLGTSLLNNFVVRLDFRRQRLFLYPPDQFNPDVHLGADYHEIPCHRAAMPYVDISVDGIIHGGAFFNTGAQQFFTLAAWVIDAAGITYEVESVGMGTTVHGNTVFGIIRPEKVQMGNITINRPRTHVEMLSPGEAYNPHRIASFGNAFFNRYTVTFDLFHKLYYIEGI